MLSEVGLFKALGDEKRVRILKMLEEGELCVCEITEVLGLRQPTVSKHLSILKEAGLIKGRREGRWSHYRLSVDTADVTKNVLLALLRNMGNESHVVRRDREKLKGLKEVRECA